MMLIKRGNRVIETEKLEVGARMEEKEALRGCEG